MQLSAVDTHVQLSAAAAAWPLAAGLAVVLWSKLRAARPVPVRVRARNRR
jgi:hypothetical protein